MLLLHIFFFVVVIVCLCLWGEIDLILLCRFYHKDQQVLPIYIKEGATWQPLPNILTGREPVNIYLEGYSHVHPIFFFLIFFASKPIGTSNWKRTRYKLYIHSISDNTLYLKCKLEIKQRESKSHVWEVQALCPSQQEDATNIKNPLTRSLAYI